MMSPTAQPFLIGTYTRTLLHVQGSAHGLLAGSIDLTSGELAEVAPLVDADNPAYVVVSANGTTVYAINETDTFTGQPSGGVSTFHRDAASGRLTARGACISGGTAAAHLAISRSGRQLAVANYGGGTVALFPIGADGTLGARARSCSTPAQVSIRDASSSRTRTWPCSIRSPTTIYSFPTSVSMRSSSIASMPTARSTSGRMPDSS